jgi:hypothetical protein
MIKLTELQRFANSFKLKTPVPTDIIGILAKDPGKQAQIIDRARRWAEEENPATATSDPVDGKMTHTEVFNARTPHQHIEESRYASTNQHVSAPDTVQERPVVRMPLADQSNSKHEVNHGQMLHENHLLSLQTQTLEALTANGQDLTTDQPKSVSRPGEHRPKTYAEILASQDQGPMEGQRNSIQERCTETFSTDGSAIIEIEDLGQEPEPRRTKRKPSKRA